MTKAPDLTGHYDSDGIAERILATYREVAGPDAPLTPDALAPLDQFHTSGLDATKRLAGLIGPKAGERLIDIGSGIGGPARWFAATFGCHVTGIDLTGPFCEAAQKLNAALGLTDRVEIHHGSALALPFADNAFDRGYSQNVVMNIADKVAYYREALRVVKPGGLIAFSVVGRGSGAEPTYPVPWASRAEQSFLSTPEETRTQMQSAGAEIVAFEETTERDRAGITQMVKRLETGGAPRLSLNVLMGDRFTTLQLNSSRGRLDGRLSNVEAVIRKPAGWK